MQKKNTPNIENNEINVSINRQFSVFSFYNFTRNDPQIMHMSVSLKIKSRQNKKLKRVFMKKI